MLNIEKIIANELVGKNDWELISKEDLTLDFMKQFKNKLDWSIVFRRKNINIDNSFIDELIEEGIIKYDEENYFSKSIFRDIASNHVNELWFAKKYNEYFGIFDIARSKVFKASELIKIFGKPKVGTPVTYKIGSDAYPFTVIESNSKGLKIVIQEDIATPTESHDYYGNQDYTYSRNPNGRTIELKLNAKGRWTNGTSGYYSIGYRRRYSDPSF